jgi:hypothetical protein
MIDFYKIDQRARTTAWITHMKTTVLPPCCTVPPPRLNYCQSKKLRYLYNFFEA